MIAMGHEVGVTAIQLASAYCALANGGYLLKPRIIRQIMDENENIIYSEEPIVVRKIADELTIKSVRKMLRGVITKGTGKNADIPGWKVAGKTGTAQKWKNGKYSNNDFISNFIGFFNIPNFFGKFGTKASNTNSYKSSFGTGVLAVAVATPCTAPFMGSALGLALTQPNFFSILIFLFLGVGFSLPYLVISLFPQSLSYLPKPGNWMETFRFEGGKIITMNQFSKPRN